MLEKYLGYLDYLGPVFWLSVLLGISILFYFKDKNKNKLIRLAVSAPAFLVAGTTLLAWAVLELGWSDDRWLIFQNIMGILTIVSLGFSFYKFNGDPHWHYLHIFTVAPSPLLWLYAAMAFQDRWL